MGAEEACVALAAIVQRSAMIKSPGGYLRNLTEGEGGQVLGLADADGALAAAASPTTNGEAASAIEPARASCLDLASGSRATDHRRASLNSSRETPAWGPGLPSKPKRGGDSRRRGSSARMPSGSAPGGTT